MRKDIKRAMNLAKGACAALSNAIGIISIDGDPSVRIRQAINSFQSAIDILEEALEDGQQEDHEE